MHTGIYGHDITREQQPRNDRNGLGLRRGCCISAKRDLQALGAYFCRTFFLFGEDDRSLSFCPKWDGRSLIMRWRGQSMRSPRMMGLGTYALTQSKLSRRQADAFAHQPPSDPNAHHSYQLYQASALTSLLFARMTTSLVSFNRYTVPPCLSTRFINHKMALKVVLQHRNDCRCSAR